MAFFDLRRIPKRLATDRKIVRIANNWLEIIRSKFTGNPVKKIILRNGLVIEAAPEINLNFLFHEIFLDELYSPKDYEITSGDIVFDIGANIGVFSLYAAAKGAKVYAFEPFPDNVRLFELNLTQNKDFDIKLFPVAVTGNTGKTALSINDSWLLHSIKANAEKALEVDCISLDEALADVERCDLLKIDCEGSEYEIFGNALPETLAKIKRMVGEYHNFDGINTGETLKAFLENNSFKVDGFYKIDDSAGFISAFR